MTSGYRAVRISTSGTNFVTNIAPASCFVTQIVISVENAGTTWKLRVQDKTPTNPLVLIPETTLSAPSSPTAAIIHFDEPIFMNGGIDVVTTGTAGAVCVWFNGFVQS